MTRLLAPFVRLRGSAGVARAIALVAGCALSASSWAAPGDRRGAPLAESLFRDAKGLVATGDYAEACPKFAESHRIDPQLGTLLHLATCHEQEGKTASAWAEYGEAAEWAAKENDRRREKLARDRIAALEPRLSHLMVELDAERAGLQITLDGNPLGVASLATPLPVDPGQHLLVAEAPGAQTWSLRVNVAKDGEVVAVRIPKLAAAGGPVEAPGSPGDADDPADAAGQAQRISGWLLGGVGLAGLVVMAIFGVRASDQADDADGFCAGKYCTAEGLDLHDDARASADIATAAFVVGIACLGTGLTLVLSAPSSDEEVARREEVGPDGRTAKRARDRSRDAIRARATIRPLAGGVGPGPVGAAVELGLTW